MNRLLIKLSTASVLALAITLGGCGDALDGHLLGPEAGTRPLLDVSSGTTYSLVQDASTSTTTLQQTIGTAGGQLEIEDGNTRHRLQIPSGAVADNTVFQMKVSADGLVKVRFTATSIGSSVENDVGSKGFLKPLRVEMEYETLPTGVSASDLQVLWLKADGTVEPALKSTEYDPNEVAGYLDHFSDYAIGFPDAL